VEAVGERGTVRIETGRRECDEAFVQRALTPGDALPGAYACVRVADSGCGMAPEVTSQMFDPFFSAKPSHHGIGLSAVWGIMRIHGGFLRVETQPGSGTTVELLFPAGDG
jgi:signal transduction histidine kinase